MHFQLLYKDILTCGCGENLASRLPPSSQFAFFVLIIDIRPRWGIPLEVDAMLLDMLLTKRAAALILSTAALDS